MIGGGAAVGGSMLLIGTLYATHANNTKSGQYAIIALIYIVNSLPPTISILHANCSRSSSLLPLFPVGQSSAVSYVQKFSQPELELQLLVWDNVQIGYVVYYEALHVAC